MIKIIDGARYNTETAEEIFTTEFGMPGDFHFRVKSIYLTKKGNWFIYHCGGHLSDMAVPYGSNGWTGSEDIEVINEEEAYTFLEEHNAYKAIDKYFADRVQDA